jgi:iron complex outermembrane recepter protein
MDFLGDTNMRGLVSVPLKPITRRRWKAVIVFLVLTAIISVAMAQQRGTLRGVVTLYPKDVPLRGATVTISALGASVETDRDGRFEFENIPPGAYEISAHLAPLGVDSQIIEVRAGTPSDVHLQLAVSSLKQEITVTASGREETAFNAFKPVSVVDSFELVEEAHVSLGEVLERTPGIAKRSWGPGSSRPVIRGFDGDRVLILQDGIKSGSLSSQSGDHGESLDVLGLERVEVVKGPATFLYGSNAVGGVVNAITRHHQIHEHAHVGIRGYFSGVGGSNNSQGGGSGGLEYGTGHWLFWGSGSGHRTSDYSSAAGPVPNSQSRNQSGQGGLGWYNERGFLSAGYGYDNRRYGIPFAAEFHAHHEDEDDHDDHENDHGEDLEEEVLLQLRRHNLRFVGGLNNLGSVAFRLSVDYTDYEHDELEVTPQATLIGTAFENRQLVYRGTFDHRKPGILSGTFGFLGTFRDYSTTGREAISPPVNQTSYAVFGLEELDFEKFRLQFGGRLERTSYDPTGLPSRSFTGLSGASGIHVPLWKGGAFVTNYSHFYRAPALEELYNYGPHIGNLAFEIGNPDLRRESGDGIDLSLRHNRGRVTGKVNFFHYNIRDFVFLAPTGEFEDGLREANYDQADTRYSGAEVESTIAMNSNLWLLLGLETVRAELRDTGTPLPRIPPTKGRIGLEARYGGFSFRPELVLTDRQERIFPTETDTAGYALGSLRASYTVPGTHFVHVISVSAYNLGNALYRNHLSLIKDLAPEIGRGVRFGYTVRFF